MGLGHARRAGKPAATAATAALKPRNPPQPPGQGQGSARPARAATTPPPDLLPPRAGRPAPLRPQQIPLQRVHQAPQQLVGVLLPAAHKRPAARRGAARGGDCITCIRSALSHPWRRACAPMLERVEGVRDDYVRQGGRPARGGGLAEHAVLGPGADG
jgi:hypothetical protein